MKKLLWIFLLVATQAFGQTYSGTFAPNAPVQMGLGLASANNPVLYSWGRPAISVLPDSVNIFGTPYSHVLFNVGSNYNPLTAIHQVAVYTALTGNAYTNGPDGHIAAFESAIGTSAETFRVGQAGALSIGSIAKGAGSTITRSFGILMNDETAGDNNAFVFNYGNAFTGNWFINYSGSRPTKLGGDLGLGRNPDAVANARVISLDGAQYDFIRFYVNGTESGRITVTSTDMYLDNFGTGATTIRTRNGVALVLNVDGSVTVPSLAGSGSRIVRADSSGRLSAP